MRVENAAHFVQQPVCSGSHGETLCLSKPHGFFFFSSLCFARQSPEFNASGDAAEADKHLGGCYETLETCLLMEICVFFSAPSRLGPL